MIVCNQCGSLIETGMRACAECGLENQPVPQAQALPPLISKAALIAEPNATQVRPTAADSKRIFAQSKFVSPQASEHLALSDSSEPPDRSRRSVLTCAGGLVCAVFLLTIGAIGSRMLFQEHNDLSTIPTKLNQDPANEAARSESVSVTPAATTQPSTFEPVASPLPTQSAIPKQVEGYATREVEAALHGWVAASNAHDLDTHMSYYADTLDIYFGRSHVSSAFVRADRARAYTRYYKLDVRLSNLSIRLEDSPATHATAVFDKSFRFEGDKVLSGSVQQTIWLTKTNGRWLITGEKDSRVYYLYK